MSNLEKVKKTSRILALAAAGYLLGGCEQKPEVDTESTVPSLGSAQTGFFTDAGDAERGCRNTMQCLVVSEWTRIGQLEIGPRGTSHPGPLALCGASKCDEAMVWSFDDSEAGGSRLYLRSGRDGAINENPVFIIEQHMSQNAPARVGIGVPQAHDISHELEVNGTVLAEDVLAKAHVGIGTTAPTSELHIVGDGDVAQLTISPDGDNEASAIVLCQDKDCANASIWRYDGIHNNLFLYFKDTGGAGFDDDRDRIALSIEHHANSDARIGINLPIGHDIRNVLEVGGNIVAEEIEVVANIADYVFDEDYHLMPLQEVEKYVDEHRHLPGIPSKEDVAMSGGMVSVGVSYAQLLRKIEELTLYSIRQNERIEMLEEQLVRLAAESLRVGQLHKQVSLLQPRLEGR